MSWDGARRWLALGAVSSTMTVCLTGPATALASGPEPGPAGALPETGVVSRVSGAGGQWSNQAAYSAAVSAGGRCTAFATGATNLGAAPASSGGHVWMRDGITQETVLVSRTSGLQGTPANGDSSAPSVSADGHLVAFASTATNLAPGDEGPDGDVFVRDLAAGSTSIISHSGGAAELPEWTGASDPDVSGDGRWVAFTATRYDGYAVSTSMVLVRDLVTGDLERVSADGARAASPSLSHDGRHVAFHQDGRIIVRDRQTDRTEIVNVPTGPASEAVVSESWAWNPDISADGQRVAFTSGGFGLTPDFDGYDQTFVRDRVAETTVLASRQTGASGALIGGGQPALSGDGRVVAFSHYTGSFSNSRTLFVRKLDGNYTEYVGGGTGPSLSHSGRFAAFQDWRDSFFDDFWDARIHVADLAGSSTAPTYGDHCAEVPGSGDECPYGRRLGGDRNCDGAVRIAVLGDSYISGEGAADDGEPYRNGTDAGANKCHRSERSWAINYARRLAPSAPVIDFPGSDDPRADKHVVAFLACSGAVTDNVDGRPTAATQDKGVVQDGEPATQLKQLERLDAADMDVVLISIGGNDAEFSDVVKTCVLSRCLALTDWKKAKIARLDALGQRVAETLAAVRATAPNAFVARINYPDPLRPLPDDCGSLGMTGVLNAAGIFADGNMRIDDKERAWLSSTFLTRLNQEFDAASKVAGVKVVDVADRFRDHAVCSDSPYSHGLKAGSEVPGIGKESFHPTAAGQDALFDAALQQLPPSGIGNAASPPAIELVPPKSTSYLSFYVDEGGNLFSASSQPYVVVRGAEPNSVILVTTFSIGAVGGRATTDADGNAIVPVRLGAAMSPGAHHVELWTAEGKRLGAAPILIADEGACPATPDADADGLGDLCDLDGTDGPAGDADGDGVSNGVDGCPLVAGGSTADADADGEPDACDPDAGADLFKVAIRGPLVPPAAVAPSAPRTVRAAPSGPGELRVTWEEPGEDGGAPVSGFEIAAGGRSSEVAASADETTIDRLEPGAIVRVRVRARNAQGLGAAGVSSLVAVPAPVDGTPTPTPTTTPTDTPSPGPGSRGATNGWAPGGSVSGPADPGPRPRLGRVRVKGRKLLGRLTGGPGILTVTVERAAIARGNRCGPRRRCTVYKRSGKPRRAPVSRTFAIALPALSSGRYRVTAVARTAAGASAARRVVFRVGATRPRSQRPR